MHGTLVTSLAGGAAVALASRPYVARQDGTLPGSVFHPPSTISDTPSPSPSPFLFFNTISELTECTLTSLSWFYSGPDAPMSLTITNVNVSQSLPSTQAAPSNTFASDGVRRAVPTGAASPFVTVTLSSSLSPSSQSFTWTQVAVPEGWYNILAAIPSLQYITSSGRFFVQEAGDTTCLVQSSSTTTNPPSSSVETATTGTTAGASASATPPAFPVSGVSKPVNKGAITGGVIGGLLVLAVVVGFYLFFLRSRRRAQKHKSRSSPSLPSSGVGGGGAAIGGLGRRGWGGLSSVDSNHNSAAYPKHPSAKKPYAAARHHSQADSLGPIIPAGAGASEDELQSYRSASAFSPSEEKFASPFDGGEVPGLAAASYGASPPSPPTPNPDPAPTQYPAGRRRESSAASSLNGVNSTGGVGGYGYGHHSNYNYGENIAAVAAISTASTTAYTNTSAGTRPPGRSYSASTFESVNDFGMGTAGSGRRPSATSTASARHPSLFIDSPSNAYPPSPAVFASPTSSSGPYATSVPSSSAGAGIGASALDRAPSGASSNHAQQHGQGQRKTPRKPVPVYHSPPISTSDPSPGPAATALPTHTVNDAQAVNIGTSGHYTSTRHSSREGGEELDGDGVGLVLGLSHKSSFGPGGVEGRQLHYLIPDMPPPQG